MGNSAEDDYDKLPFAIQALYSRKEWMWKSDREKATISQSECEPEELND